MASEAAGAPVPRAVDSSAIATSPNHLSSCAISSCVTRYEDEEKKKGKFTAFVIEIKTHGGLSWTVERRYRQFYNLNKVRHSGAVERGSARCHRPPCHLHRS